MPLLGAHMSIAGGMYRAFDRIKEIEGQAMQVFVKNERQWQSPAMGEDAIRSFRESWEKSGSIPVAAHDTYLINLAAADPAKLEKSVAAFADELRRTESLGIPYLITHPGSHVGQGLETGLNRFVTNLDRAIILSKTSNVLVLIETTAGQGNQLGSAFEEIAFILSTSRCGDRLAVCFDTCHVFAAGYDIRTPETYRKTLSLFDSAIGLTKLKFFHLNDCKKELGSRVDRHEHIGKGKIGLEAFRLLLNDSRFAKHPMVLETPKGKNMKDPSHDKENLRVLRSLLSKRRQGLNLPH